MISFLSIVSSYYIKHDFSNYIICSIDGVKYAPLDMRFNYGQTTASGEPIPSDSWVHSHFANGRISGKIDDKEGGLFKKDSKEKYYMIDFWVDDKKVMDFELRVDQYFYLAGDKPSMLNTPVKEYSEIKDGKVYKCEVDSK